MIIDGKLFFNVRVGRSRIHGKGAYAGAPIPAKKKIGSLGGEIISMREGRKRARRLNSISLVELWNGKSLDASVNFNELRFINHSCSPNTFMRTIGHHVEFYALRPIRTSEELTCNYGLTHHDGNHPCQCGAPNCKGYL